MQRRFSATFDPYTAIVIANNPQTSISGCSKYFRSLCTFMKSYFICKRYLSIDIDIYMYICLLYPR